MIDVSGIGQFRLVCSGAAARRQVVNRAEVLLKSMENLRAIHWFAQLLLFGVVGTAARADFDAGLAAYVTGNYEIAFQEFHVLDEKEFPPAQYDFAVAAKLSRSEIEQARRLSAELIRIIDTNHVYIDDPPNSHSVAGLASQRNTAWSRVDFEPELNAYVAGAA